MFFNLNVYTYLNNNKNNKKIIKYDIILSRSDSMRVVVTAGGTGGHIYPASSIINKLKEHYKDLDLLYIGTTNRMEKDIVPKRGIDYIGIEMYGLTKNIMRDVKAGFTAMVNVEVANPQISQRLIDVVSGAIFALDGDCKKRAKNLIDVHYAYRYSVQLLGVIAVIFLLVAVKCFQCMSNLKYFGFFLLFSIPAIIIFVVTRFFIPKHIEQKLSEELKALGERESQEEAQ